MSGENVTGDPGAKAPEEPPPSETDGTNSTSGNKEKTVSAVAGASRDQGGESYRQMVWRLFWKSKLNKVALIVVVLLLILAAVADFLASDKPIYVALDGETYWFPNITDPPELRIFNNQLLEENLGPNDSAVFPVVPWGFNTHDLDNVLAPPSAEHWLGTDDRGRDVLSRIIHGTRVSLLVGFLAVISLLTVGVVLGSAAGYLGGILDGAVNRCVEILNSIPGLLIIVVVMNAIGPTGWDAVLIMGGVIGAIRWTTVARLIRGEILKVRTLEYVDAARSLGAKHGRIILRHIVPNSISPVFVAATFAMAAAILLEAAISFLGFGIPDDMASWGVVLQGVRFNLDAWWLGVAPGFALFITLTAINLLGEGLRDAIDPRLKT
ncbi:MAG: ABC transporter permease [Myxococcota bacterium]